MTKPIIDPDSLTEDQREAIRKQYNHAKRKEVISWVGPPFRKRTPWLTSPYLRGIAPECLEGCFTHFDHDTGKCVQKCIMVEAETLNIDFPKCLGRPRKTQRKNNDKI